ncbi:hypothetical protein PAHAL_6G240900 [Panicum hallii]|uniref:Uncharacterized protein n=1 Tax=Panicum hallii TaxID=206008 RepID=A0A2T8IHF5_9POAL|nr:hypothetical protein PAHAL_6G240900 [Panicum hallii]
MGMMGRKGRSSRAEQGRSLHACGRELSNGVASSGGPSISRRTATERIVQGVHGGAAARPPACARARAGNGKTTPRHARRGKARPARARRVRLWSTLTGKALVSLPPRLPWLGRRHRPAGRVGAGGSGRLASLVPPRPRCFPRPRTCRASPHTRT